MPELPEVQTTVSGLKRNIIGLTITDVWTDYNSTHFIGSHTIKDPAYFKIFKKTVRGSKIIDVTRRAKNVLIHLSNKHTIIVHMKMTGHLLYGDYDRSDPFNRFVHFILYLSNGKNVELSDMRKFAKVTVVTTDTMHETDHLKDIGPEPLERSFTYAVFKSRIFLKSQGKIKPTLLDQSIIAGIGNIYSDESLFRADIHPEEKVSNIPDARLKKLYEAILVTLKKGIDFGGDSMSDYRNVDGKRGKFQEQHQAYRKTNQKCMKKGCSGKIVRSVVAGRGTHYCNVHQKLSTSLTR